MFYNFVSYADFYYSVIDVINIQVYDKSAGVKSMQDSLDHIAWELTWTSSNTFALVCIIKGILDLTLVRRGVDCDFSETVSETDKYLKYSRYVFGAVTQIWKSRGE